MERGYLKVFRRFFLENELWAEKRVFSKAEAWMDLMQAARWKDEPVKLMDKRGPYILEQGDVYISDRYLAERWQWSTKKVRNFLTYLIERESIRYKIRTNRRTIINVINLRDYIKWGTTQGTTEEPQKNHRGTTEEPKKNTVKPVKPDKPGESEGAPTFFLGEYKNVELEHDSHKNLVMKVGKEKVAEYIGRLSTSIKGGGEYFNHGATILKWLIEDGHFKPNGKGYGEKYSTEQMAELDFADAKHRAPKNLTHAYIEKMKKLHNANPKLGILKWMRENYPDFKATFNGKESGQ